jgi:hypothetical protein
VRFPVGRAKERERDGCTTLLLLLEAQILGMGEVALIIMLLLLFFSFMLVRVV